MSKYDYKAMNDAHVVPTDESERGRTVTQIWLAEPSNVEKLFEIVSCGKPLRRYCETEGLAYSSIQRALTSAAHRDRYYEAQEQQAEHLLGEMERISVLIEGDVLIDPKTGEPVIDGDGTPVRTALDPKAGAVLLSNLQWRISKFNARRYSDRQVIEQHTFDHTQAHIEAVRALARQPRRPAIEGQSREVMSALSHEPQPSSVLPASYSMDVGNPGGPMPVTVAMLINAREPARMLVEDVGIASPTRPSPIPIGTATP